MKFEVVCLVLYMVLTFQAYLQVGHLDMHSLSFIMPNVGVGKLTSLHLHLHCGCKGENAVAFDALTLIGILFLLESLHLRWMSLHKCH